MSLWSRNLQRDGIENSEYCINAAIVQEAVTWIR